MKKFRGFTLIEIVLVIALIGVTASVVITLVNPAQQFRKANDAKRKADLTQLQAALELYRNDEDGYPDALPTCGDPLKSTSGTATYMQHIPCDPKNQNEFTYTYVQNSVNTYTLVTCLENVNDKDKDEINDANYCSDSTTAWSYTLHNP